MLYRRILQASHQLCPTAYSRAGQEGEILKKTKAQKKPRINPGPRYPSRITSLEGPSLGFQL